MKSFTIEDKLTNLGKNYIFFTESIGNIIVSSIFLLNNDKKVVIKKVERDIMNIETIQEEMTMFHNKILSIFFKALRNKDKNPEDSIKEKDIDSSEQLDIKPKESNYHIKEYINTLIDKDILSILISKKGNITLSSNTNDIKKDIEYVYNMMSSQEDNIYKLIGRVKTSIFYYENYSILYYKIDSISIAIAISNNLNMAKSIKVFDSIKNKILEKIS